MSVYDGDLGKRISDVVQDYLSETAGGIASSFHIVAEYVNADGQECWMYATPTDQKATTTLGLLRWSLGVADYEQFRYMASLEADDE